MRVLILCGGADTGGQGIRIRAAFQRLRPDWEVRSVTASRNYIGYDEDLFWSRNIEEVIALYDQADVVHVRNTFDAYRLVEKRRRPKKRKPVVIQHHGTIFRTDHRQLLAQSRALKAVGLVSTIDLRKYAPAELEWLPVPFDLAELQQYRANAVRDPDKIIVSHSPTSRRVKDTALFEGVGDEMMGRRPEVECRVIEQVTWRRNMELKAEADIVYDQLVLGWGNNAIEAWAMGIPVVGGVVDPQARRLMLDTVGALPVEEATHDTLGAVLERLVADPEARAVAAQRGYDYVTRFHSQEASVPRLVAAYERAAN